MNIELILFRTFVTANAVFVLLVVDAASLANLFPISQDERWSRNVGNKFSIDATLHPIRTTSAAKLAKA